MSLGQLLILHLMAGAGVAGGVYLATRQQTGWLRWFQVFTALVFWPMYLPLLLQKQAKVIGQPVTPPLGGALDRTIAQVDEELEAALKNLEGQFGNAFAHEKVRLHELRGAWAQQARQIREMDQLLSQPEYAQPPASSLAYPLADDLSDRLRDSRQALEVNVTLLRKARQEQVADLLGTLTEVRELVSLIHLAVYSREFASQANERTAQITAAVDALSARIGPQPDESPISGVAPSGSDSICLAPAAGVTAWQRKHL